MTDYMSKEMSQTPTAVTNLVEKNEILDPIVDFVIGKDWGSIVFIGCGSSYYAGLTGAYASHQLINRSATPISALDFLGYRSSDIDQKTLLFALSQSGETYETVKAARAAKQRGANIIAATNNPDSTLGQLAPHSIEFLAGEEYGAGTKTVVAEMLAIYMFFLKLAKRLGTQPETELRTAWDELKRAGSLAQQLREQGRKDRGLVKKLAQFQSLFVVGAGPNSALAFQAANVLKEVSKLHAEASEIVEFRHGPLEVVDGRSAVLFLGAPASPLQEEILSTCNMAKDAGAFAVAITAKEDKKMIEAAHYHCQVPAMSELLGSILKLVLFHEWAYALAKERGLDPNEFRNIVKTWTD